MRHENNNVTVMIVVLAGIVAAIVFINRWIDQKAKDITANLPGGYTVPAAVEQTETTTAKPRRVVIDPRNDPLAPVVPRVDAGSPAPKSPPREPNPGKIYEPMMNSVILAQ